MSTQAEKIIEKLNKVYVDRDELRTVVKDRLDFGFDSIYFRYSEAIEELSWYKQEEAIRNHSNFNRKQFCDTRRMHFYNCLEQLVQAHIQEDKDGTN